VEVNSSLFNRLLQYSKIMMMDTPDSREGLNVDKPAFRSPLNAFLTGSEFISKFDGTDGQNSNEWPQDGADTNDKKDDNTHSEEPFHSTFEIGDMPEAHDDDDDDDDDDESKCPIFSYCTLFGLSFLF
jgi:hypothetical protein